MPGHIIDSTPDVQKNFFVVVSLLVESFKLTGETVEKLKPKEHDHKISIFVEKVQDQIRKTRITPVACSEMGTEREMTVR